MLTSHLSSHGCKPILTTLRTFSACQLCLVSLVYLQKTLAIIHHSGTPSSTQCTRPSWTPPRKEGVGVEAFCGSCFLKVQITWMTGTLLFFQSLLRRQKSYLFSPRGSRPLTPCVLGNAVGGARRSTLWRHLSTMMIFKQYYILVSGKKRCEHDMYENACFEY